MYRYVIFLLFAATVSAEYASTKKATCLLSGADGVKGQILFTETPLGIKVTGSISGLIPGKHGFHVHNLGDLTNGCASMAGHYNPFSHTHGAPEDEIRHVGDLGNVLVAADGVAHIDIDDKLLSFDCKHSILGRGVVVHALVDDLGKGGHKDSLTTGNAGGRVGCGVIGISAE